VELYLQSPNTSSCGGA